MFALASILLIITLINPDKEKSSVPFIEAFYSYFIDTDVGLIIGKIIIVFILYVIMSHYLF